MKIIENIISWEPLQVKFIPLKKEVGWEKIILQLLQGWEKDRTIIAKKAASSHVPLEYYIAKISSDGSVTAHIEWLCEDAIPIFQDYIKKKGSNIKVLIIGEDPNETVKIERLGSKVEFIRILGKTIVTRTGKKIAVPSFHISKYPITVEQYVKFVRETGYKTTNEKQGDRCIYYDNDLLIGMEVEEKESTVATCLSYYDAIEYCNWSGFSLPTDTEWLSAAVVDWEHEYKQSDISETVWNRLIRNPYAMKRIGPEWIDEYNAKTKTSVVRYGPGYFLEKGWKSKKLWKRHSADYTDILLQFRVCK